MLELKRLNGEVIWINPDQIKMIFKSPDTTLVFMDDSRITVKNEVHEIKEQWLSLKRSLKIEEEIG